MPSKSGLILLKFCQSGEILRNQVTQVGGLLLRKQWKKERERERFTDRNRRRESATATGCVCRNSETDMGIKTLSMSSVKFVKSWPDVRQTDSFFGHFCETNFCQFRLKFFQLKSPPWWRHRDATLSYEQRQRFMEEISGRSASTFSQAKVSRTWKTKASGKHISLYHCYWTL